MTERLFLRVRLSPRLVSHSTLVTRFFREPLVHFLMIGAALFLFFNWKAALRRTELEAGEKLFGRSKAK
jgi:hypothetical protein